jgi:hypothetical protein
MDKPTLGKPALVTVLFSLLFPSPIAGGESLPLPSIPTAGLSIETRVAYRGL